MPAAPPSGPKPASPSPAPRPSRPKREKPVGVIAFLAVLGIGIALKSGGTADSVEVREVFEDRVEVGASPRVAVESVDGSIEIGRGAPGEVSYRVEASADGPSEEEARRSLRLIRPVVDRLGDAVRVRVDRHAAPEGWSGRATIRLKVPADAQVRILAGNGRVRIKDVVGSIAAKTTNGRIEVEDAAGPIVLQSTNGSIRCEATDALVSAETSNGAIVFEGSLAPGSSRLISRNGSVTLRLPVGSDVRIDADSRNGQVDSDFPLVRREDDVAAALVSHSTEPSRRVALRTANGAIRVEAD
ncbi:DUF4097 family beta strand repeat-containing protein [Tautonia sociabilis]|nr:DUF4097 family beta strand repeat-containing protein [Tautonia sociabilis]